VNGAVYEPATKQGKRTRSLQQSDPDFFFFQSKRNDMYIRNRITIKSKHITYAILNDTVVSGFHEWIL